MRVGALKRALPHVWTLVPMYGFERLADCFHLSDGQSFYLIPGRRLEAFIAVLAGSLAPGAYLRDLKAALGALAAALATSFALVYVFCDPRVCCSAAPDGLEALRFRVFLGAVGLSGGIGEGLRTRGARTGWKVIRSWGEGHHGVYVSPPARWTVESGYSPSGRAGSLSRLWQHKTAALARPRQVFRSRGDSLIREI
jgi:hypothetical protein